MKEFLIGTLLFVGVLSMIEGELVIGLIIVACAILWAVLSPKKTETEEMPKPTLSSCPFCGTPYEKWQTVGAAELRGCYHCKRHCYRDGSTVGLNEEDKQTLADEAEDCQRVAAGTYDNSCMTIIKSWRYPLGRSDALFTIQPDNVYLFQKHLHRDLSRLPTEYLDPHLKTYAGRQALAHRMHPLIEQKLGDTARWFRIDSSGDVVTVEDDFENYLKRMSSDT